MAHDPETPRSAERRTSEGEENRRLSEQLSSGRLGAVLADAMGALVAEFGADGKLVHLTENHEQLVGTSLAQLVGKTREDLFEMFVVQDRGSDLPPDLLPRSRGQICCLRLPDGGTRWVEYGVSRLGFDDGEHEVVITLDVTDQVETELELRQRERQLRDAQRIASVGCWSWCPDTEELEVSEEFRTLLGLEGTEALTGRELLAAMDPEDRARYEAAAQQALQTSVMDLELRLRLRDGGERWFRTRAELDRDSPRPRLLGTIHEITELRSAEARARASRRRMEQILNQLPSMQIVLFDSDCRAQAIYSGVAAEHYGLKNEYAVGARAGQFLEGEADKQRGLENIRRVFETGQPLQVRETVPLPSGTFVFDVSISPLRDDDGEITRVLSVCHDVTSRVAQEREQARLESRVQAAERLESLGLLAGGIAHDFNNLLVGIIGNAELAISQLVPGSSLYEMVDSIRVASEHAADLTERLLACGGQRQIQAEDIDLGVLIGEMRGLLRSSLPSDVRLRVEINGEGARVAADPVQIRQILLNLLTNATEASRPDGEVVLRAGIVEASRAYLDECLPSTGLPPGSYAFIEVSDHGDGIAEDDRVQIFDPFYTTKRRGRGLGLSAVMGIVKAHGGAIHLDSTVGRGTTLRVLFPPVGSAAPLRDDERKGEAQGDRAERGAVLVVDDAKIVRDAASTALERIGFRPLVAPSGVAAIEMLQASKDDVVAVLLDVTMPGMDGMETFRALRSLADLPVLFMSGYTGEWLDVHTHGEERVGRIRKPFSIASLGDALDALL